MKKKYDFEMDEVTRQERLDAAQGIADALTAQSEENAREAFAETEVGRYFASESRYAVGLLVNRAKKIAAGERLTAIRPYDAETIYRLMTEDTMAMSSLFTVDRAAVESEPEKTAAECVEEEPGFETPTKATDFQEEVVSAYSAYVEAAAVYAKHVGSSSLDLWAEMLDLLSSKRVCIAGVSEEVALRLKDLEARANQRLRLDQIIAALPKFKPPKKGR